MFSEGVNAISRSKYQSIFTIPEQSKRFWSVDVSENASKLLYLSRRIGSKRALVTFLNHFLIFIFCLIWLFEMLEGAENTESIEYDMEILYKGDSHTKALFDFVNTNGDDVLDLQEITNFAKKFTKKSLSQMPNMSLEKFIELYLEVRDKDKSGFLSWDECMYNENAEVKAASSDSSPLESDLSAPDSQTESKCETDPEGQCSLEDAPHPLSESKADFEADLEDDSEDDSEDDDDLEIETVESPKSPKPDFQQKMTFQFKNNKFEPINSDDDASFAAFKAKFEAQLKKQMAEKNQNPDSDWGTDLDLDFDMDSKDELWSPFRTWIVFKNYFPCFCILVENLILVHITNKSISFQSLFSLFFFFFFCFSCRTCVHLNHHQAQYLINSKLEMHDFYGLIWFNAVNNTADRSYLVIVFSMTNWFDVKRGDAKMGAPDDEKQTKEVVDCDPICRIFYALPRIPQSALLKTRVAQLVKYANNFRAHRSLELAPIGRWRREALQFVRTRSQTRSSCAEEKAEL